MRNVADRADSRGVNGAEWEKEGPGGACLDTGGGQLVAEGSFEGSSTRVESEGLGSVVCHHLFDSPGDIVQRFVPTDRLEFTVASGPDSLERGGQPVLGVDDFRALYPAWTDHAARMTFPGHKALQLVVFELHMHSATSRTDSAYTGYFHLVFGVHQLLSKALETSRRLKSDHVRVYFRWNLVSTWVMLQTVNMGLHSVYKIVVRKLPRWV
jgi:hypothetical protein